MLSPLCDTSALPGRVTLICFKFGQPYGAYYVTRSLQGYEHRTFTNLSQMNLF